ncbi:hypothetical protein ACP70R_025572 [Stipagrostis hirtigluma subsp. patula]
MHDRRWRQSASAMDHGQPRRRAGLALERVAHEGRGRGDRVYMREAAIGVGLCSVFPNMERLSVLQEIARLAVHSGAAGIIVSNHGARQLDYVPATISALEEVVTAAHGRIPVYLDAGVRRGTDVFKALALGAAGVFRPVVFALAAEGEAGVRNVLRMLREEFELTMALSGCTSLADITRSHILTEGDRLRPAPRL